MGSKIQIVYPDKFLGAWCLCQKERYRTIVCYDMKLTLSVINNPKPEQNAQCEVRRRSLIVGGERKPWVDVYRECVSNLHKVPEFRRSLEIDSSI